MTATEQDFRVYVGDVVDLEVTITDGATPPAPINLTGYTAFTWTVKAFGFTDDIVADITKTLTNGITVTDAVNGILVINLLRIDTLEMAGDYYHELVAVDGSGNVAMVMNGKLRVDVYNPQPHNVSYMTIADADKYFLNRVNTAAWTGATDGLKLQALITATNKIDANYIKGRKTSPTQVLEFPRYPDTLVPRQIQIACCEEAIAIIEAYNATLAGASGNRLTLQQAGVKEFRLGDLSEVYDLNRTDKRQENLNQRFISNTAANMVRLWVGGSYAIC